VLSSDYCKHFQDNNASIKVLYPSPGVHSIKLLTSFSYAVPTGGKPAVPLGVWIVYTPIQASWPEVKWIKHWGILVGTMTQTKIDYVKNGYRGVDYISGDHTALYLEIDKTPLNTGQLVKKPQFCMGKAFSEYSSSKFFGVTRFSLHDVEASGKFSDNHS